MHIAIAILSVMLIVGVRWLFKDTLNRIQYIERLRLYWIVRDDPSPQSPRLFKSFMRQTAEPYWRGSGYTLRIPKRTIQVGRLTNRVPNLEAQVSNLGWLDTPAKELRQWS